MEINCPKCQGVTAAELKSDFLYFSCQHCLAVFRKDSFGKLQFHEQNQSRIQYPTIKVGEQATLRGERYTVTGVMVKKVYTRFYFAEYTLEDANGALAYLSENEGHWIFLKAIDDRYEVSRHPRLLTHNNIEMNLYDYTDAELSFARGFFPAKLPDSKIHVVDYISPPFIISIEEGKDIDQTYFGEHISAKEVSKAFPSFLMPVKSGTGIVQPFKINVKNFAIVVLSFALLIAFAHMFIYRNQTEKVVLQEHLPFSSFDGKDFVSPTFELDGATAPLTIQVHSPVDNTWANVQIALINEKNNEQTYASKDIEYYHGYTDGESWTEGSSTEEFNICGVEPGNYHLVVTPQKSPEDGQHKYVDLLVTWNDASTRNVWFMGIALLASAAIMYFIKANFEQKRWAESDYSPYS